MSVQASLFAEPPDDEEPSSNPYEHIFFALTPDPRSAKGGLAIGDGLMKSQWLTGTLRPERLLHVTLRSLPGYGECDRKGAYARAALAAIAGLQYPQTQVVFDRAALFRNRAYVLTGDNDALADLVKTLGTLLHRAGIASEQHTPHMTIAYTKGNPSPCEVPPLIWTATEVVLIRSYPGESRHERLGSVPLAKR